MRRLILFDIDGTLLSTDGAARRAFHAALIEVYGATGPIATHSFDGKTDPQIARELLSLEGLSDASIDRGLDRLFRSYLRRLATELATPGHSTRLYPGVTTLLDALRPDPHICLALLTGNIAQGAALKLRSAGIADYFRFGAYGSDCEQRTGLPGIAVQRALADTGRAFNGHEVVIIGDTPNDVTCGQALGVFTIAVATGRHTREDLLAAGADIALQDLSDTRAVLDLLSA
jgi:phosphoglycolate phosphatase